MENLEYLVRVTSSCGWEGWVQSKDGGACESKTLAGIFDLPTATSIEQEWNIKPQWTAEMFTLSEAMAQP